MTIQPTEFDFDLAREDDVGLVMKAHLHIEHQLMEFVETHMPFKERCDWQRISYAGKVELALAFGIRDELRKPLGLVGKLRNDFAHNLKARLEEFDSLAMFNGLPPLLHGGTKQSYEKARGAAFTPSAFDRRELLVLILLNIHQAVKAAVAHQAEQMPNRSFQPTAPGGA